MANAAVFSGDYVDVRFVKSRKVAQIVMEIPIERAAEFIAAFGVPNPAEGVPVALARLDQTIGKSKPEFPKDKKSWADMMPSQQAALRGNDKSFWVFLDEKHDYSGRSEVAAAAFIRRHCSVASRSELDANKVAAGKWHQLDNEFGNWQRGY